jgi:outer membrane protein OmpA-like peptidoglycan-associated protein
MSSGNRLREVDDEQSSSFTGSKGALIAIVLAFGLMIFWIVRDEAELSRVHKVEERQHEVLHEIEMVEDIGERLDARFFSYDARWHRNVMTRMITFPKGSAELLPDDQQWLLGAARAIETAIHDLKTHENYGVNFTFTVLIEGRSSNDGFPENNVLSYKRALAVKQLWEKSNVFLAIDSVDLQVAGSGPGGIGREYVESNNQRILIHIIPKIGHLPDNMGA